MNLKAILIICICSAVLGASVSAVIVSGNRATRAKAVAEAEAAAADAAAAEARKAEKEAQAEADRRRAAEAKKAEAESNAESSREARMKAEADERAAADNRKAKEAEAARARSEAEAAASARDTARANAEAAREAKEAAKKNAEAEASKAQAQADLLAVEKAKADKSTAEARLLELRRLDLTAFARELAERERDVAEREQALRPEKTIADLSWAGGEEDSIIDEKGNITKQTKKVYLPENDMSLPRGSRVLFRTERVVSEETEASARRVRDAVVGNLEALYREALTENRVVDADFYRQTIKSMYPDWEFRLPADNDDKKEEQDK